MKKIFLSLSLFFIFFSAKGQEVTSSCSGSTSEPIVTQTGQNLCDCMNQVFDKFEIHPRIKLFIKDMIQVGEAAATTSLMKYMENLNAEKQVDLSMDMQKMLHFSQEDFHTIAQNIPSCQSLQEIKERYANNEVFHNQLRSYFKNQAGCEFTYILLKDVY